MKVERQAFFSEISDSKSQTSESDDVIVIEEEASEVEAESNVAEIVVDSVAEDLETKGAPEVVIEEEASKIEAKSDVTEIVVDSVTEDLKTKDAHEVVKVDDSSSVTLEKEASAENQEPLIAASADTQCGGESESNTTN